MSDPIVSRRRVLSALLAGAASTRMLAGSPPVKARNPRDVSWLPDIQRPPDKIPPNAPRLKPIIDSTIDRAGWETLRQKIRQEWSDYLGRLPLERSTPELTVLKEDRAPGCVRQLVRYESEPGELVEGYLLRPSASDGSRPGVVAMHSTVNHTIRQPAGVEGRPEKAFGLKLAQRGIVVFCPRCFLWQGTGSYQEHVARFKNRHPKSRGMAKMLWDATRAVDVLSHLSDVDPERIGAVGHSLGAKEALYLAAFDERVKVTVSSEGGVGRSFSNWEAPWYLGQRLASDRFARDHHELLALVAPRPFLLIGGDSADGDRGWPYIEAALRVYQLYDPPARVGMFNHRQGHSVPPEAEKRIYEWFSAYL